MKPAGSPHTAFFTALVALLVGGAILAPALVGTSTCAYSDVGADLSNAHLPAFIFVADTVAQRHFPSWSFQLGLGDDTTTLQTVTHDPFNWPLFLAGPRRVLALWPWMWVARFATAALVFALYLRAMRLSPLPQIVGGLAYAFSGFNLVWGQQPHFATAVVLLALVLLTAELWLETSNWLPLLLSLAATAIINFQFAYYGAVLLILYVAVRLVGRDGERLRSGALVLAKTVGIGAGAVALSAWSLLPMANLLMSSPRTKGQFTSVFSTSLFRTPDEYAAILLRFISPNMLGTATNYAGQQNYFEAPVFYCGTVALLCLPYVIASASGRARKAVLWAMGLTSIAVFLSLSSSLLYVYRWTAIAVPGLALVAAVGVHELREAHRPALPWLGLGLALATTFLGAGYAIASSTLHLLPDARSLLTHHVVFMGGALVLQASLLLALYRFPTHAWPAVTLVLAVAIEAGSLGYESIRVDRKVLPADYLDHHGFFDWTNEALDRIAADDHGWYRVDKNFYSQFLSDSLGQHFRGTRSYASLNNPSYLRFLGTMGVPLLGNHPNFINGLIDRPVLEELVGVKYLIVKGGPPIPPWFQLKVHATDVNIYENQAALPLGFVMHRTLGEPELRTLDEHSRDEALLDAAVIEGSGKTQVEGPERPPHLEAADGTAMLRRAEELREEGLNLTAFREDEVSGTVTARSAGILVLSIPYSPGWSASVDGASGALQRVDSGFLGLPVTAGPHQITLRYRNPWALAGLVTSILTAAAILMSWVLHRRGARANRGPVSPGPALESTARTT